MYMCKAVPKRETSRAISSLKMVRIAEVYIGLLEQELGVMKTREGHPVFLESPARTVNANLGALW
jgi:hypothetical protein